jgi:hypothetical protein
LGGRVAQHGGTVWEEFSLAGTLGLAPIPMLLTGSLHLSGSAAPQPVELRWSAKRSQALAWIADWEALLKALEEDESLLSEPDSRTPGE